jgi:hypothetical protein
MDVHLSPHQTRRLQNEWLAANRHSIEAKISGESRNWIAGKVFPKTNWMNTLQA